MGNRLAIALVGKPTGHTDQVVGAAAFSTPQHSGGASLPLAYPLISGELFQGHHLFTSRKLALSTCSRTGYLPSLEICPFNQDSESSRTCLLALVHIEPDPIIRLELFQRFYDVSGRAAVQRAVLQLLSQFLKPVQLGSLLLHQLIMPTSGSVPRIGHPLFHFLVVPDDGLVLAPDVGRQFQALLIGQFAKLPIAAEHLDLRTVHTDVDLARTGPLLVQPHAAPTHTGSGGRCPLSDTSSTIAKIRSSPSGPPNLTAFSRAVRLS